MKSITIQMSEEEFQGVLHAYQTLQSFLEKVISPNELYYPDFLTGLQEAVKEVNTGNVEEIKSFGDFIR